MSGCHQQNGVCFVLLVAKILLPWTWLNQWQRLRANSPDLQVPMGSPQKSRCGVFVDFLRGKMCGCFFSPFRKKTWGFSGFFFLVFFPFIWGVFFPFIVSP